MAQKLVETENIEFFVLVERMQDINQRLEKDTAFLLEERSKVDENLENENFGVKDLRDRELKKRRKAKEQKEEWLGKKTEAMETYDDQVGDFEAKMTALRNEFEPRIEKKKTEIAEKGEDKRDLLEFMSCREDVEKQLAMW